MNVIATLGDGYDDVGNPNKHQNIGSEVTTMILEIKPADHGINTKYKLTTIRLRG